MKTVLTKELLADTYYTKPVYLDSGYIVLSPEVPLAAHTINKLAAWEIRELRTEGEAIRSIPASLVPDISFDEEPPEEPETQALRSLTLNENEAFNSALAYYNQFYSYVESLYKKYTERDEINLKDLFDKVKTVCESLINDKKYFLLVLSRQSDAKDYIVSHSTRSTVLAIILGSQLKLPAHRLIELGVASVLHEIGMVRLPKNVYMSERPLTEQEKKTISAHPVIGYKILKEKQVPLAICLATLEHHERMNGSGYPRALGGDKISLYARIIAVACSYDAVTAKRPYKEAREGFSGMVHILQNEGKQYDEAVIKSLVYSLSVFPVGSYVFLTNASLAQVVDTNPDNPRCPIVRVLGSKTPDGKEIILQTSETGVRILKPVSKEDVPALLAKHEAHQV